MALVALCSASCTSDTMLESRNVGPQQWRPVRGASYYLPKKLLRVEVWRYGTGNRVPVLDKNGTPVLEADGTPRTVPEVKHFALHARDGSDEIIVPDHRHQYVIAPEWDIGSHDYLKVDIATDGLLNAVQGEASDERPEIAAGIGDLFSMLVSGSPDAPRRMGGDDTVRALTDEAALRPRLIAEYEFDPVNPRDRARVQTALAGFGITMGLTPQPDCPLASSGADCCQSCDCTKPGIYYRLPVPYRFTLSPAGLYREAGILGSSDGEWESLEGGMERTVLLPNEAICLYVPITRAAFVKSHTSVRFDRGMLVEVETDKPSELLGFVRIPLDAASAVLAIPAELLTVRIKRTNLRSDLADQQRAYTEAERDKIQSQIDLMDAARKLRAGGSQDAQADEEWK